MPVPSDASLYEAEETPFLKTSPGVCCSPASNYRQLLSPSMNSLIERYGLSDRTYASKSAN